MDLAGVTVPERNQRDVEDLHGSSQDPAKDCVRQLYAVVNKLYFSFRKKPKQNLSDTSNAFNFLFDLSSALNISEYLFSACAQFRLVDEWLL